MDWNKEARLGIKLELALREVGYKELMHKLQEIGVVETERSIASKISRGTFSHAFFLQCMRALGVKAVDVSGEPASSARTGEIRR